MPTKIILHLDMNSYFASCEQQANPHLRGRPVGVCEHLGGIIIAPSVEAKRLGIKLGTTVWDARKIYPKIVLLPVDPAKYRHVTALFLKILYEYSDCVEKYSIDEAFADLTGLCKNFDEALLVGLEIKQRLRREVGEWVSCSVGIGPNKLVAKIAADLPRSKSILPLGRMAAVPGRLILNGVKDKEILFDNLCIIKPEEIPFLYDYLDLMDVPGIGPRLERALHKLGIFSLRELAEYPLGNLINQFGIGGFILHKLANFQDTSGIVTQEFEEIKSIGHSYTVPKPISELRDIKKLMLKLAEKIGRRLRRKEARGNVIHYFHSDKKYEGFSKQRKIKDLIFDGRDIYRAAWGIFQYSCHSEPRRGGAKNLDPSPLSAVQDDNNFGIKIMGISVGGLKFNKPQEPILEIYKRPAWLVAAMDEINNKYGEFTIRRGRLMDIPDEWGKDTVGFAR